MELKSQCSPFQVKKTAARVLLWSNENWAMGWDTEIIDSKRRRPLMKRKRKGKKSDGKEAQHCSIVKRERSEKAVPVRAERES